jgi:hypothetical protein
MTTKIHATPEGREGIYVPEKESLKAWIKEKKFKQIHNFIPSGSMMIGADHDVASVLADIDSATRLAILTGDHANGNMGHALSLIFGDYDKGEKEHLEVYDIGRVEEGEIEVV